MPKGQAHIIYKGSVQGVGFRFTVERIAIKLGVTGWVKNLDDGDVEVVAEAEKEILEDFLEDIRNRFSRYIRKEEIDFSEVTEGYREFEIKF